MTTRLAGDRLVLARKVTDYLLNAAHPAGASKATFFLQFGFTTVEPSVLLDALSDHPVDNDVVTVEASDFGIKSIVRCRMKTPDGRDPCITTVWMLDIGSSTQRFVTAYPVRP